MPQLRLYLPGAHTNAGRILKNGDRSARCLTIYSADPMGSPSIWCFYAGRGVKETPKPHGPVDKFEGGSRRPRTLIPLHSFSLPPPPSAAPVHGSMRPARTGQPQCPRGRAGRQRLQGRLQLQAAMQAAKRSEAGAAMQAAHVLQQVGSTAMQGKHAWEATQRARRLVPGTRRR